MGPWGGSLGFGKKQKKPLDAKVLELSTWSSISTTLYVNTISSTKHLRLNEKSSTL